MKKWRKETRRERGGKGGGGRERERGGGREGEGGGGEGRDNGSLCAALGWDNATSHMYAISLYAYNMILLLCMISDDVSDDPVGGPSDPRVAVAVVEAGTL